MKRRDAAVYVMAKSEVVTLQQMADRFKLTRERVRQLLVKHGVLSCCQVVRIRKRVAASARLKNWG